MPEPVEAVMLPTSRWERIRLIDTLRGLALFGVFAANMRGFFAPSKVYFQIGKMWGGLPDQIAQGIVDTFITGKCIFLFAFLFGLGFAIQMDRAEARGARFGRFYVRRMLLLLLIGMLHVGLFWWGDILIPYSLTGLVLLLFRKRRQKTVGIWFSALVGLPLLAMAVFAVLLACGVRLPFLENRASNPVQLQQDIQQTVRLYTTGSWLAIAQERVREWAHFDGTALPLMILFFTIPRFLLGLLVWRSGILQHVDEKISVIQRAWRWAVIAAIPVLLARLAVRYVWPPLPGKPTAYGMIAQIIAQIEPFAMAAFYAASLALLYLRFERWRQWLAPFSYVGRMALTNYLAQSILCTTLANSYGLRLFGKVGPALGWVPTLLIFALQVFWSRWWLEHHAMGPAEAVWRRLTYGSEARPARQVAAGQS